ncbi:hypothetical protein KSP40_PGU014807 [Platanthera guangdongensis]|uniref:Uncharacterized protein n=1 Tax=Platanthera guangdongensis TaxID=2320717 RepID=A0ABR2LQ07_9ASPA
MILLSWDLEGVPGRVSVSVLRRQPPGSLYRSPQLFQKLWPFMQADVNHSNALGIIKQIIDGSLASGRSYLKQVLVSHFMFDSMRQSSSGSSVQ